MKNKLFNMAVVAVSAAVFMYGFFWLNGFNKLVEVMQNGKPMWLLGAVFLMLLYWVFETLIIQTLTLFLHKGQKLMQSFKAAMIGQFFSAITPYQTGAQPALYVSLRSYGIEAGTATSILMMKFVVHQTVLTVYSFVIIILKFNYFDSQVNHLFYICLAGFIFNAGIIFMAVMFSINKKFTKGFLTSILKFLNKIRLVKNPQTYEDKIEKELEAFHDNAALIVKNKKVLYKTVFINTLQLTVLYAIPYFIYRSFNFNSASLWNMLAAQTFVMMIVSIVPIPGGMIGADIGFAALYGRFFTENTAVAAMFIWRLITYYSCIGIGGIFAIFVPSGIDSEDPPQL